MRCHAASDDSSSRARRGRYPTKRKPSPAIPAATSAVSTADGPGSTVMSSPSFTTFCTRSMPGSCTPGIPASVTSATVEPSRNRRSTSSVFCSSLCWKKLVRWLWMPK